MSSERSKRLIDAAKRFESAFNEGNIESLKNCLNEQVSMETAEGSVEGREEVVKFLSQSVLWGKQWLGLDGEPTVMVEEAGQPPITVFVSLHGRTKATFKNGMSLAVTVADTIDFSPSGEHVVSLCREESSEDGLLSIGREMLRNKRDFVQVSKQYRAQGEPGWAVTGIVLGMRLLAAEHQAKLAERAVPAPEKKAPKALVEECEYWLRHANAAYSKDKAGLLANFPGKKLEEEDVFLYAFHSTLYRPGYYGVVDHERNEVVLSVKGTSNIQDAVRDVCALPRDFNGHLAHAGMADGAIWLRDKVGAQIEDKCKQTGYKLVVTGHSLGAGIAALISFLLRPSLPSLHCYTFASPAAGGLSLCNACEDFVTAVIAELDCVPRLSICSMDTLRRDFAAHSEKWTAARLIPTSSLKKVLALASAKGGGGQTQTQDSTPPSTPSPTRKAMNLAASGLSSAVGVAAKAGGVGGAIGKKVVVTAVGAGMGAAGTAFSAGTGATKMAYHAKERARVAWVKR